MEIIIAIVNTSINAKEFGTTGLAAKLLTLDNQKRGELIQDEKCGYRFVMTHFQIKAVITARFTMAQIVKMR